MQLKRVTATLAAVSAMAMFAACGQKGGSNAPQTTGGAKQAEGVITAIPCFEYDTPEYLTGFGEYRSSSNQLGELVIQATERAKYNARQKLGGRYKGVISDYRNSIGNNQGNDIATKMEAAGDQAIDRILNDARASCNGKSEIGPDGHMSVYVGIRIYKAEVASAVAKAVDTKLTEDEKLQIRFDESQFRDRYKSGLQDFKGEN